jgi:hypothetical protein
MAVWSTQVVIPIGAIKSGPGSFKPNSSIDKSRLELSTIIRQTPQGKVPITYERIVEVEEAITKPSRDKGQQEFEERCMCKSSPKKV